MKPEISVVAPCFNEEGNVEPLVARLERVFEEKGLSGEIVLVDDASKDATRRAIKVLQSKWPNLVLVVHDENGGIAKSLTDGIHAARGTYVCIMDADLQNLPEDVWRLYRELIDTKTDVVSGWRSRVNPKKDHVYISSRVLSMLLNLLFGMHLKDNKSAFMIARRDVLLHILAHRFSYHHPQTFMGVSAHAKGYSIRQIETRFDKRHSGVSYLAGARYFREAWKTLLDCMKGLVEFRIMKQSELAREDNV